MMIENINLLLILLAGLVAMASPGPATLAIAGASMTSGRRRGLALASGVTTGSILWSVAAALGLGTIMASNAWAFEVLRYVGAAYLLYLAYKSASSALKRKQLLPLDGKIMTAKRAYSKGLALHLTNPKAVLFFGSLYAIGIPAGASMGGLCIVVLALGLLAFVIFHSYAVLFSSAAMVNAYEKLRRVFESVFAVMFGLAGFKILTSRLG